MIYYDVCDDVNSDEIDEFLNRVQNGEDTKPDDINPCTYPLPIPDVKLFKWKNKIKRIYEDDDFIIDLVAADTPTLRVSIFKDNHFQDEVFIKKEDYID